MKTLILSPTYNEKDNISTIIHEVFVRDHNYHMLINYDKSTAGTADIDRDLKKNYSNLNI